MTPENLSVLMFAVLMAGGGALALLMISPQLQRRVAAWLIGQAAGIDALHETRKRIRQESRENLGLVKETELNLPGEAERIER